MVLATASDAGRDGEAEAEIEAKAGVEPGTAVASGAGAGAGAGAGGGGLEVRAAGEEEATVKVDTSVRVCWGWRWAVSARDVVLLRSVGCTSSTATLKSDIICTEADLGERAVGGAFAAHGAESAVAGGAAAPKL